jgi:hypothetical protein
MQCRLAQPLKQPWSGQSKTGSMHSFVVQELAPPSSLEAGGEPRLKPPSGRVIGGRVKPPDELLDELALPPSSLSEASSDAEVVASSPAKVEPESSSLTPLLLGVPLLLELPLPDPLPPEVHDAPLQLLPDELVPVVLLPNPVAPVESLPVAQPAASAPQRSAATAA